MYQRVKNNINMMSELKSISKSKIALTWCQLKCISESKIASTSAQAEQKQHQYRTEQKTAWTWVTQKRLSTCAIKNRIDTKNQHNNQRKRTTGSRNISKSKRFVKARLSVVCVSRSGELCRSLLEKWAEPFFNLKHNCHPGVNGGFNFMVSDWSFVMTCHWIVVIIVNMFWPNQKFCIILGIFVF